MNLFWIMAIVALVFSSIGFKKYVWFISIGYGFAVAAIGAGLLILGRDALTAGTICASILFILYGLRLGGYLAYRELKSASYNNTMKTEIKSGKDMSIAAKCAIWISAALLYVCETSPVIFRIMNKKGTDAFLLVGIVISIVGLIVETTADLQKNAAKKVNPRRFVDTGLYKIVRCPNYFGEMLFWTGVFVGGIPALHGALQWIEALVGYIGIIYVMFGGARRLIGNYAFELPGGAEEGRYKNVRETSGKEIVVGFENHSGRTWLGERVKPLGKVLAGYGNNGKDRTEGVHDRNVFGTYSHGPVLPKNPVLCDRILLTALKRKYGSCDFPVLEDRFEKQAHQHMMDVLHLSHHSHWDRA